MSKQQLMIREIKFRLWDKKRKKMCEVHNLTFHDLYGYKVITIEEATDGGDYHSTFISTDDYELVEYTGLKDKNGVKIYEGDILKITNTARFCQGNNYSCHSKIELIEGHAYVWPHPIVNGQKIRYGAEMLFSGMAKYIDKRGVATEDVEVIGNIYENPELLEGAGNE